MEPARHRLFADHFLTARKTPLVHVVSATSPVLSSLHHLYVSHQMAASFRLPLEQMNRLDYLARRKSTSKAQIVKEAIDRLYEQELQKSDGSALDLLIEGGFEPSDLDFMVLASDKEEQRRIIRERLAKKDRL